MPMIVPPIYIYMCVCDREAFTPFHPHYQDEEKFGPMDNYESFEFQSPSHPARFPTSRFDLQFTTKEEHRFLYHYPTPNDPRPLQQLLQWSYPEGLNFQHPLPQ